jgi:hypothetical protein
MVPEYRDPHQVKQWQFRPNYLPVFPLFVAPDSAKMVFLKTPVHDSPGRLQDRQRDEPPATSHAHRRHDRIPSLHASAARRRFAHFR